jgi:hypothetical protein
METESEQLARARTLKCREQAYEVWEKYGKQEPVMLAILERLLETIAQLEEGK